MIDILKNNGQICTNNKAMYVISDFLESLKLIKKILPNPNSTFDKLSYDTRKVRLGESSIFFALKGHQDGHKYVKDAFQKGVRNFVVSDLNLVVTSYPEANFIWVEDTLRAMQAIVIQHLSTLSIPIVGITGSNGKTIVKDWLAQLLKADKQVYQSPKSYNSQLGVALSLWNLTNDFDLALIEAGISTSDEMYHLEKMIQPNWGIFTSLGTAHREGFSSKEEKLQEKWKLFAQAEKIFAPSGHLPKEYLSDLRVISWGVLPTDKLIVKSTTNLNLSTQIKLIYGESNFEIEIPFTDKASIDNALTCLLIMLELGYSVKVLEERMRTLKPLDMRLKLKKGINSSSIIDDTYSNDLASLNIALDFLNQQNQYESKKLVLSDFDGEEWTAKFQSKLQHLLNSVALDEIILIGNRFKSSELDIQGQIRYFDTTEELLANLLKLNFSNSVVLIKGARKYKLESLSSRLTEKSHETVLQINLKSLEHNLKQYRSRIDSSVKMMAMVKAFSYGSGSFEVANVLQYNNVDYLTVAFVDEGSELRRTGVKLPIMVLSPHESAFDDIIQYGLEPEIYSLRILKGFIEYLKCQNIQYYPIHLKLDTGMHRLGFIENEIDSLIEILSNHQEIKVVSVFSHLVGAGAKELLDFTTHQISLYNSIVNKIKNALGYDFIRHICNTSGISKHPEAHLDMVRLGIGLYGYDMSSKNLNLEEVGVLNTTITQIKHIPKTETVGYDRKGILTRDSIIATVKIGYADGYNRRFGNGVGEMQINGQLVRTVGNICMDMCMLDVTDVDVKEGDEVNVFPDITEASRRIGTIPYELLTGISSRVKRVYYYE